VPKSFLPAIIFEADHVADKLEEMEKANPQLVAPMIEDQPPLKATPESYLGRLMTQVRSAPDGAQPPKPRTAMFGDNPEFRASDEDRAAARKLLAIHMKAGRLRSHELDERSCKAGEAVTCGDLDTLFADLPVIEMAAPSPEEDRSREDDQPLFGPAALALLHGRAQYEEAALAATNGKAH
jgi:hypothetical protein